MLITSDYAIDIVTLWFACCMLVVMFGCAEYFLVIRLVRSRNGTAK